MLRFAQHDNSHMLFSKIEPTMPPLYDMPSPNSEGVIPSYLDLKTSLAMAVARRAWEMPM